MKISVLALTAILIGTAAPCWAMTGYSPGDDLRADIEFRVGADLVLHGRYEEAVDHLAAALSQSPDDPAILEYLASAHRAVAARREGSAHDAELRLAADYDRRLLEQGFDEKGFLEYMGGIYLDRGDVADARDELKAMDAVCPSGCREHDHLAAQIASHTPAP